MITKGNSEPHSLNSFTVLCSIVLGIISFFVLVLLSFSLSVFLRLLLSRDRLYSAAILRDHLVSYKKLNK